MFQIKVLDEYWISQCSVVMKHECSRQSQQKPVTCSCPETFKTAHSFDVYFLYKMHKSES